ARSKPRTPKSTTRALFGGRRSANRLATSLPKASSPRKMLPMPATRMCGRVIGRPHPSYLALQALQAGAAQPLQAKRRSDGRGAAEDPYPFPDHHPGRPLKGFVLHSPARWPRLSLFGLRVQCRGCPRLFADAAGLCRPVQGPHRGRLHVPMEVSLLGGAIHIHSSVITLNFTKVACGAMESHQQLRGKRLGSLKYLAGAIVD